MIKTEQFDKELSDVDNMIDITDFKEFYNRYLKPEMVNTDYDKEWNEKLVKKSGKTSKEIRFALLDNYRYARNLRIDSDDQYSPKNIYAISVKKADYIIAKVPVKRIDVILLGIICGLTREEIDHCLQRYLKQSKLYARDIDDFIWIYLVEHRGMFEENKFLSLFYKTRAELKSRLLCIGSLDESVAAANTIEMNRLLKTSKAYIEDIINENVFKSFIETRASMIEIFDNMFESQSDIKKNAHNFVYHNEGSGAYKKLNKTRNVIKNNRLPAKRHEILAMCLHLNQDKDNINKFLDSCGMERLLPKNIVESIIIFVSNYISSIGNYYSDGYISDDDSQDGKYKFDDLDAIKASWMWEYIVDSSGEDCIDNGKLDFNLPVCVINGIIHKEFLENESIDKESDLYKYMVSLYALL